jgi:hypothetical protein
VQFWLKLPLTHGGDRVGMILCYDAFLPGSEVFDSIEEKLAAAR